MKKVLIKVLILIVSNVLLLNFIFTEGNYWMIIFFLYLLYVFFTLPFDIAGLFTKLKFGLNHLNAENLKSIPNARKHTSFAFIIMVLYIALEAFIFYSFVSYSREKLANEGVYTYTFVKKTKEKYSKNTKRYYVFYDYIVDGKKYNHREDIKGLKVGDSLKILYLPSNPDNHKVIVDK
ncbi:DUF3592 domain-containing protein [Pseudotenacibaculum haliotis]|uniref:DUF3592 domain-containing protein n=1 Tax=Pseudotenacibaculum haliotis TaxID=1862138 RepID=A0ABW5LQG0_9FLAO